MDSESEDIFVSDSDYRFRSLTTNNFVRIVNEVISNQNIDDGTMLCFQVFYKNYADSIYANTFNGDYKNLNVVAQCISRLRNVNKFNSTLFLHYIISEFVTVPLEIVWWLHKNEIVYFVQYCEVMKLKVSTSLLNFLSSPNKDFMYKKIIGDLLEDLLRCTCRPITGIYRLPRSKTWELYCSDILNDILDKTLKDVFKENILYDNFLNYLPSSNSRLPNVVLQRFFKSVLTKILLFNVNETDEYSACTYQQLWHLGSRNKGLDVIFEKIFSEYSRMEDIISIMKESDDKINWKYTLAAVSACVKVSRCGSQDLKDVASSLLEESFKGGKLKPLLKCLLLIRQGSMEPNMKMDYQTWYSLTFGTKSSFKTRYTATFFKFLINSFINLIPYESITYLKIQINQVLDAPAKCNSLTHDYKGLCRSRLQELERSAAVGVDGGQVTLLHLIEETVRKKTVSPTMAQVIRNKNFYSVIIPQIVINRPPFTTVKQILISENYLTEEELINIPSDPDLNQ